MKVKDLVHALTSLHDQDLEVVLEHDGEQFNITQVRVDFVRFTVWSPNTQNFTTVRSTPGVMVIS